MDSKPRFRVEGKDKENCTVWLQCSNEECQKDIRPLLKHESIKVDRGYYCKDCDDGALHLNMPKEEKINDNEESK